MTGAALWFALLVSVAYSPLTIFVPIFLQNLHGFDPLGAGYMVAGASLGWTVADNKGPFNGQQALRDEKKRGSAWKFVGVEIDWVSFEKLHQERGLAPHVPNIAWRSSHPLMRWGQQVGYCTSGTWSPLLKKYIALGHVNAAHGDPGSELELEMTVEHRRQRPTATVRKLPFFDPPRKRA